MAAAAAKKARKGAARKARVRAPAGWRGHFNRFKAPRLHGPAPYSGEHGAPPASRRELPEPPPRRVRVATEVLRPEGRGHVQLVLHLPGEDGGTVAEGIARESGSRPGTYRWKVIGWDDGPLKNAVVRAKGYGTLAAAERNMRRFLGGYFYSAGALR